MSNDITESILRQRLVSAEKQLRQFERDYKGDTSFYADQIAYVNALREHLASMP